LDLASFIKIARIIQRVKPDIVHTHTSKAGLLGRLASKVFSPHSKLVHTYHGHLLQGYFSSLATAALIFTEKSLAKISDKLITMGNEVKVDLLQAGIGKPNQFMVAFPGVKVKEPTLTNLEVLNFKSKNVDKIIFTFVGRLSPIKRCDRIIQLAKTIEIQSSQVHFLIIGDGELRKSLEEESIGLPITFVGWQSNTEDWLAVADAAILLSDNEAVPLAMIEAGLAGLPVIATNVGSMSDVVIDNVNGYLVETSMDKIIEKVLLISEDASLREQMGAKGRELAIENYSVSAMISKHEQIYSQLISRSN
jgi:glycosyltransferase involved in cell wall biosynthesis